MSFASSVNFVSGLGTVLMQVAVVLLAAAWLFGLAVPDAVQRRALPAAFAVALLALLGSLTYSELIGYAPCKLCWVQRIFMFPEALLLGMALWGRHKGSVALIDASLILALLGGAFALYHSFIQYGILPEGSCVASGASVSCAERFVFEFGYITIPLMALTSFLLISLLLNIKKKSA